MKTGFLLGGCLALGLGAFPAQAGGGRVTDQSSKAGVIAAVDRFFAAISSNDARALEELYLPEADLFVRRPASDGQIVFKVRSAATDIAQMRAEKRRLREYYWAPKVRVHGGIAQFWAPYAFEIDGKRSHCGIDAFDLILVEGQWRIASAMYTVEPQGCAAR